MNVFEIVAKLYTEKSHLWINTLDDSDIQPVVIQKFLCMNTQVQKHVRYLDSYMFYITPKMYLLLAWCALPKYQKAPFTKYLKPNADENIYTPIFTKIKKILECGDEEFVHIERFIKRAIDEDKVTWFRRLGCEKELWQQHGLDVTLMNDGNVKKGKSGLDLFF